MALIHQLGLTGMLLFYWLIGTAAWKDRRTLPLYVLLFLAGMTVNLLELFPINFLIGILLCRSLIRRNADASGAVLVPGEAFNPNTGNQ